MDNGLDQLRAIGGTVAGITFSSHGVARETSSKLGLRLPLVSDQEKKFYTHFKLPSANWANFLRPEVLIGYLSRIMQGWMPLIPRKGDDIFQLGGDFILNGNGENQFAWQSETPVHRPGFRLLLAEFQKAYRDESGHLAPIKD